VADTVRLNVNLPAAVADDLVKMSEQSGKTMTEIVRNALGLVKLAQDVSNRNQKLIITDSNDKPLKEILLP